MLLCINIPCFAAIPVVTRCLCYHHHTFQLHMSNLINQMNVKSTYCVDCYNGPFSDVWPWLAASFVLLSWRRNRKDSPPCMYISPVCCLYLYEVIAVHNTDLLRKYILYIYNYDGKCKWKTLKQTPELPAFSLLYTCITVMVYSYIYVFTIKLLV